MKYVRILLKVLLPMFYYGVKLSAIDVLQVSLRGNEHMQRHYGLRDCVLNDCI